MPQMAPMNWATLYLFFSALLILAIIINFFLFYQKISTQSNFHKNKLLSKTNWKW